MLAAMLFALLAGAGGAAAQWSPTVVDALEPASSGGLPRVARLLDRLSQHRRVLVVGAHPDDEDTSLLARTALGDGGEAAYLSLSRGDGGQNLIGPELGVGLGLLRSQELVSARRIDGARQFFTRAYDFGYTRSLDETFRFWPREEILEDAVRVVRRFRPQLIVAVFPPDDRAGHGQHQAAGVVAEEVFHAAGDPARYADQLEEGLEPWQAERFFRVAWWDRPAEAIDVPLGDLDPLSGRSYLQIAMASRSEHRSQDMGRVQPLGPRSGALLWIAGGDRAPATPFGGIDTGLAAIAQLERDPDSRAAVAAALEEAASALEVARGELRAEALASSAPPVRRAVEALGRARAAALRSSTRSLLDEKIALAHQALLSAEGISVDAFVDRKTVVDGEEATVTAQLYNRSGSPVEVQLTVLASSAWRSGEARTMTVPAGELGEAETSVALVSGAPASRPYFLDDGTPPTEPALYEWPVDSRESWGAPFGPPELRVRYELTLAGLEGPVSFEREAVHREGDRAAGEVRTPVRAVPALELTVEPSRLLWSAGDRGTPTLQVGLSSSSGEALSGRIEVVGPDGWPAIPPAPFELGPRGQGLTSVTLSLPAELAVGRYPFEVVAVIPDDVAERRYDLAFEVIDYPHVRPTILPRRARFELSVGDLRLPEVSAVGYVRGPSDEVPEVLVTLGLPLQELDAERLLEAGEEELDRFPVIVVGSRAYEVDGALQELHPRLMAWVQRGGTLIVQYQKYPFSQGGFFPYQLEIVRPHGRVADESAPVLSLAPEHSIFRHPNPISEEDWQGWVQERGLYFPARWDERYEALLELADPGREPERGALLVAKVGEGTWVYTGLSFFRQLPAAVPGAARLFLNLVALGEG